MYAWLTSLNIINPFSSTGNGSFNSYIIPENVINLLLGGKYMDIILQHIQDAYNKFNNNKINLILKINEIIDIDENQEYIPNSVKYANWNLISEILTQFGLKYSNDEITKVINGDKSLLIKILTKIFELYTQLINSANNLNNNNNNNKIQKNNFFKSSNEVKNTKLKKKSASVLDINNLNENKSYEECTSALEFFIISLCKNFNTTPRESIAMLANNRKYSSIICKEGIDNSYKKIKFWLNEIDAYIEILLKLIKISGDGLNMSYGIIGTAICSDDENIPLKSIKLIKNIYIKTGIMDFDWLKQEGFDNFIYALIYNENNKLEIMNYLYEFISNDIKQFFTFLQYKAESSEKNIIFNFLSSIISISKNLNEEFFNQIQDFLYDICLNEINDMSCSVSILGDSFYYFYPIDETIINKIILYFKKCIKNNSLNIFASAVGIIFYLIEKFSEIKNKYAPKLYKNIVFLFLELYDDIYKREIFLENYEKFLNNQQQIPIDILLDPYISHLSSVQNYNLSDLIFLFKIVEHPRIESKNIKDIIHFLLNICINNIIYSRTSNLILSLIFEKNIIQNLVTPSDINEINLIFIDFINNSLELFMSSINNLEDKSLLEMPYDILNQNFTNVNNQVYNNIISCIKEYRKIKKYNCNGLLAMIWECPEHDDIILQMEEENRPIYEPASITMKKKIIEAEKKEKKNFLIRTQKQIIKIQERTRNKTFAKNKSNYFNNTNNPRINKSIKLKPLSLMNNNSSINNLFTLGKKITNYNSVRNINNYNRKEYSKLEENEEAYIIRNHYLSNKKRIQKNIREQIFNEYEKNSISNRKEEKKRNIKIEKKIKNILIQNEGKYIKIEYGGIQLHLDNIKTETNIDINFCKNYGIPINLEEEEKRELKAIEGYIYEYKKNLKYYFKSYANELTQTIAKEKFIRMLRDQNINKDIVPLEQINYIIRNLFNDNIVDFNFNQFCNLLIQISYLIYIKKRATLTISETFGIFLRRFSKENKTQSQKEIRKKMSQVISLLLEKKANNEPYNLPEGFKFITKKTLKYNSRLPPNFLNILGESKYICYQVLEEIIFNIFNSSIIEPYVEINTEENIELEPEKIHKWTPDMHIAYINMDKKYDKIGIEVADTLEDAFTDLMKGKNAKGEKIIHPHDLKIIKEEKIKHKQLLFFSKRKKQLEEQIGKYKEEQKERYIKRKQLIEKRNEERKMKKKEEISKIREKFEKIMERRKKIEEEKEKKLKQKENKKKLKKKKFLDFLYLEKEKENVENEELSKKQKLILKLKEEEKEAMSPVKRSPWPDYFKNNKKNIEFEHDLNDIIKKLLQKDDIKKVFDDYKEHLKLIYNIYSKMDKPNITFNSREGMREEGFKQFLINFTILGLLVSSDQITFIYNNITKMNINERNFQSFLDYNDFEIALCYLAIYSRFSDRTRKIDQNDIDNTNGEFIENFFKYMGLELPFKKYDLEQYINKRRSMTVKDLIKLQNKLRNKDILYFKKNEKFKEIKNKIANDENKNINNIDKLSQILDIKTVNNYQDDNNDEGDSSDEDIDINDKEKNHICSKNVNEYQKKKKNYELKLIEIKEKSDIINKEIKKQNDIINNYKTYINEINQKLNNYNEKMNIKYSDNNNNDNNDLNNDANIKLKDIYQQIGVFTVFISQIKEINIEIKNIFQKKIESIIGDIQEKLNDIDNNKIKKKKKLLNVFESIEQKIQEIENILTEFEEKKKTFYDKNKNSENEMNKLKSFVNQYNEDYEKWKDKYQTNNNNENNNSTNNNKENELNNNYNNLIDNNTYNNNNDSNKVSNICLLKVKDLQNKLNLYKTENLFKNEEEKKYENYIGESFILKKNWNEVCFVYNNYNIYDINYEIQAIGLRQGGYFPSCNHQCYYDFEILLCTINGEKAKYEKIGTLLQLKVKLYNLESAKIHIKYKELRKLNIVEIEKRNLYRKDYYGLRESLAGQIAKFTLILKSNTLDIINFDTFFLVRNENNKNEIEYIWGGLVPKEGKRVLISFTRKQAEWSFRTISQIISKNKKDIKNTTCFKLIEFIGGNNKTTNINCSSPQTKNIVLNKEKNQYIVKYIKTNYKEVQFVIDGKLQNSTNGEWIVNFSDEEIEKMMPEKDVKCKEQLQKLAKKIIEDFDKKYKNSDFEFLDFMKIALWVNKNIEYNLAFTGKEDSAMEILNNRAGVCHHMTILSNALLYSLGYKVIYISGYAGGSDTNFTKANEHSWSLIKIEGKWYPFDTTWGIILGKIPITHIFSHFFNKSTFDYKSKDLIKFGNSKTFGQYIPKLKLKIK